MKRSRTLSPTQVMYDGNPPRVLLGRAVLGLAVLFTVLATWRWVGLLSEDPAPGADSERRARVLELTCSTFAALAATGLSARLVLRRDISTRPLSPHGQFHEPLTERHWRPDRATVNSGPSDLEVLKAAEPSFIGSLDEIERMMVARRAATASGPSTELTAAAVSGGESPIAGTEVRTAGDASKDHAPWIKLAIDRLASELMLINGYADLLLSNSNTEAADLRQIRSAGERSALLIQQFPFLDSSPALQSGPLDLNALIDHIRPKLRIIVSPDVQFGLSLHSQGNRVHGDPAGLTLVICALVAEADRINSGGEIRLATGDFSLKIETASPEGEPQCNSSPGFQGAAFVVGLLGGTLAVVESGGLLSFRVSLLPAQPN